MDKNILLELRRMKEIMFFDKQNPDLILKEDSPSAERAIEIKNKEVLSKASGGHDPFADIPTFNIGKGTDYPFIFYFGDSKVDTLPVVQGSKIFKINSNTTSKNILGENVGIQVGTVVNEDGKEVSNQEYITKIFSEGNKKVEKKLCLPTKEFWQLPEIQGKVYRFSTPVRSKGSSFSVSGIDYFSKTFSMIMELKEGNRTVTDSEGKSKTISSKEVSIACKGGDNGWGFVLDAPLFYDVETLKGYNPKSPEDLDDRSDWEVWYDHYGGWLEVGIGIASSLVGVGLARNLIRLGTSLEWAGPAFTHLGKSYLGGGTTMAEIYLTMATEGVMMSPIIKWQIEEGRTEEALLNTLFLLIPFVTETPGVQKFISGKYSKQTAINLTDKMKAAGLDKIYSAAKMGQEALAKIDFKSFIDGLTGSELALFNEGLKTFSTKEGMTAFEQGFKELIETGGTFGKEMSKAKTKAAKETLLGKTAGLITNKTGKNFEEVSLFVNKYINPKTSKNILTGTIPRSAAVIIPLVASYKIGYKLLKPEEQEQFNINADKFALNSDYLQAIVGIDPYVAQQTLNNTLAEITKDENTARKYASENYEIWKSPELKNIADRNAAIIMEKEGDKKSENFDDDAISSVVTVKMKLTFTSQVKLRLKSTDFTYVEWLELPDQLSDSKILVKNEKIKDVEKLIITVKKIGDNIEFYLNDVLIDIDNFDVEKWKTSQTETPNNTQKK